MLVLLHQWKFYIALVYLVGYNYIVPHITKQQDNPLAIKVGVALVHLKI